MALAVRKWGYVALGLLLLAVLLVWYDGGARPQHLIEQPVALPGDAR